MGSRHKRADQGSQDQGPQRSQGGVARGPGHERETTAKATLEDHKPGANYAAELDSVEAVLKAGKADRPEVKSHVAQVVADVREMVADYKDRLII